MKKIIGVFVGFLIIHFLWTWKTWAQEPNLFFSEYVEGSSNNKAIEIYNPTEVNVNLKDYRVEIYSNGNVDVSSTITLGEFVLTPSSSYVICHTSFSLSELCDLFSGSLNHNGNDTVALVSPLNEVLDVIGQIGFDPGAQWGSGDISTADNTIRRKCEILQGDTNGSDAFDPSLEWDGYAIDTFDNLGVHTLCIEEEPVCGNDIVEDGELCDSNSQSCVTSDGYNGTQSCSTSCDGWENCTSQEFCGDNVINGSEQCDDGNNTNDDGCSSSCQDEVVELGSISGFVFYDRNKNGVWDGWHRGEFKMHGWKVFIDENDNQKYDKGERYCFGKYIFDELAPGDYSVCEVIRRGWQSTLPEQSNCQLVKVVSGETSQANFGNRIYFSPKILFFR